MVSGGALNRSPRCNTAHAMRRFFAAMATTAFQEPLKTCDHGQERVPRHRRLHQRRLATLIHGVHRESLLGEIDADEQNGALPISSELMRCGTSHRGTSLPTIVVAARDGEAPFIR
jgi:hypothetical protein